VFGGDAIASILAEKTLLLTGTPMINYVHDLYTQLHFLDPAAWPSFEQFVTDQYFPGYKIIAEINNSLPRLNILRRSLCFARRRVNLATVVRPRRLGQKR
jgi:SNF2 family DNA or RNA helicase